MIKHGFQENNAEPLFLTGHDEKVGQVKMRRHLFIRHEPGEDHCIPYPKFADQLVKPLLFVLIIFSDEQVNQVGVFDQ